jgi:putative oxidoreductase
MGRLARFLGDALRNLILLEPLRGLSDAALLLLRMLVGAFLMWGTWDNIVSAERMHEFVEFLTLLNCPLPEVAALISVYAQFACGALILLGLLTRWAGVVMTFNFMVAVALLTLGGGQTDFRALFPPLVMIAIPLLLATHGAGKLSLDAALARG